MNNVNPLQLTELKAGKFYIPVFESIENAGEYNTNSPIYQYLGDGEFVTEYGEPVEGFYDPELGLYVATNAADGFVQ